MLDFYQCLVSRRGRGVEILLNVLLRLGLDGLLNTFASVLMRRDLYSRWGIGQGMRVTGCATPAIFLSEL